MALTRRAFGSLALGALARSAMSEAEAAQSVPGATDCHVHIIGPAGKYPMVPNRPYTPPQATVAQLKAMHARLGITRTVLVQPSFYGTDNSCMLDALAELGNSARGVAVVAQNASDQTLRDMDAKGVKGIRINLESAGNRDPKAAAAMLAAYAKKVAPLNWHIQIYTVPAVIQQLVSAIADLPVPVVIDHYGMVPAAEGYSKGLAALIDLVRARKAYVKLSAPYRISKAGPDYKNVKPIAQTLIYNARDRMLWGSDWPHTQNIPGHPPTEVTPFSKNDDEAIFKEFNSWYPDATTNKMILADNAAKLYRFM
ncbi:MAG TPA: amidohydrolase family protein [Micropepsaceae bacterium]|jgi:predicted TIM-barrel fold metal-dependent hydrolase|nr:amidohydrolase family protein [Micropepsaceae bacterium]